MTTTTAERVTLGQVTQKIGELSALEPELDRQYGEALLHAEDAEVQRIKTQRTKVREDLLALHAARRALEAEARDVYATKKGQLVKRYHVAANEVDNRLDALLEAVHVLSDLGAELGGLAAANGDSSAQFHRLSYAPGRIANIPSEALQRVFAQFEPWAASRVSLSMQAQGAGLIKE